MKYRIEEDSAIFQRKSYGLHTLNLLCWKTTCNCPFYTKFSVFPFIRQRYEDMSTAPVCNIILCRCEYKNLRYCFNVQRFK